MDFFPEEQHLGGSMYDQPLNELDDEIKAHIYNPTDPDCESVRDKLNVQPSLKPSYTSRKKDRKPNESLNPAVTKKIRKAVNAMIATQTPAKRESRSRSKGPSQYLASAQTRSTNLPFGSTPKRGDGMVLSVLDLSKKKMPRGLH